MNIYDPQDRTSPAPPLDVCLVHVDWTLLRIQKEWLSQFGTDEAEGLLNFLDRIQDTAALSLGDEIVFGIPHGE